MPRQPYKPPPVKKAKRGRYNTRLIKQSTSYTIQEIAMLFGVHKSAIREWRKQGLKPIDNQRPLLFHGGDLKAFLDAKQQQRKSCCKADEFYCVKCRAPVVPYERLVDITPVNERSVLVTGLCPVCSSTINRLDAASNANHYEKLFDVSYPPKTDPRHR